MGASSEASKDVWSRKQKVRDLSAHEADGDEDAGAGVGRGGDTGAPLVGGGEADVGNASNSPSQGASTTRRDGEEDPAVAGGSGAVDIIEVNTEKNGDVSHDVIPTKSTTCDDLANKVERPAGRNSAQ
eukprot:11564537-Karenia_brevis.AAC.1